MGAVVNNRSDEAVAAATRDRHSLTHRTLYTFSRISVRLYKNYREEMRRSELAGFQRTKGVEHRSS